MRSWPVRLPIRWSRPGRVLVVSWSRPGRVQAALPTSPPRTFHEERVAFARKTLGGPRRPAHERVVQRPPPRLCQRALQPARQRVAPLEREEGVSVHRRLGEVSGSGAMIGATQAQRDGIVVQLRAGAGHAVAHDEPRAQRGVGRDAARLARARGEQLQQPLHIGAHDRRGARKPGFDEGLELVAALRRREGHLGPHIRALWPSGGIGPVLRSCGDAVECAGSRGSCACTRSSRS
mmetsp:Transcript_49729/g.114806  ORF Transcript_49729/g.114806 Transcript_49729/m.114806 type:complete len:235 (+) Transcript_49729:42-746(+)